MNVILHFADRASGDLRLVCGACNDGMSWTTLRAVVTCPACTRLLRVPRPERRIVQGARPVSTTGDWSLGAPR
jgi:hypothetical protein